MIITKHRCIVELSGPRALRALQRSPEDQKTQTPKRPQEQFTGPQKTLRGRPDSKEAPGRAASSKVRSSNAARLLRLFFIGSRSPCPVFSELVGFESGRRTPTGGPLGAPWGLLGASWEPLGPSWGCLGPEIVIRSISGSLCATRSGAKGEPKSSSKRTKLT